MIIIKNNEIFLIKYTLSVFGESMVEYQGFCLKCKTYGVIKNSQIYTMSNGRKRAGGVCSQKGCTGKISKIIG